LKLIDVAVDAGADAVKFQKRNLEKLYAKKYLDNANAGEKTLRYLLPILQQVELSNEDFDRIVEYCQQKGITFLCSAFDADSADFLETLGVPAYKVASADLTNLPLLDHLVKKGKPLILSTGMSHMHEVELTVDFLKARRAEFALLHCNSTYPAGFEDINLRFMEQLRRFEVPVGYSGHERGIAVSTVASVIGASIIERHLTLDRPWTVPSPPPAWSRRASRIWCATSYRSLSRSAPGKRSSSRAAKSSTAKYSARASWLPGGSSPARSLPRIWLPLKVRRWASRRRTTPACWAVLPVA
jgi:N-acetylneuraminate synthase